MSYKIISYTQEELDYFYGLTREMERKEGRRIPIDELIDIAIKNKNDEFIYFLHYMQIMQRSKVIEDKLKGTGFNFREGKDKPQKYTEKEVDEFEETLNNYWKDGMLSLYETIDKAIENKNFKLVNYLDYLETKKEKSTIDLKISNQAFKDMEEKTKKIEKIKRRFLKRNPKFKEVDAKKDADALLIIDGDNPCTYDVRLNGFTHEYVEVLRELGFDVYYLKNTNHHDGKKATIGFINRVAKPSSKNK